MAAVSFAIHHDPESGVVELTFTGAIGGDALRNATTEAIALQKRTGALRFLIDANGWDLEASVVDIYQLPGETYWREGLDKQTRMALILPAALNARRGALFFEDACLNRGWNARVFQDRRAALEWLWNRKRQLESGPR